MAPPTTEHYLTRAETELRRRLPEALRARLLADNGGEVVVAHEVYLLHPVWDETNRRTISRTASHIVAETREARRWHGFPPGAVALASGNADKLIVFEWSDDFYFRDHETLRPKSVHRRSPRTQLATDLQRLGLPTSAPTRLASTA